MFETLIFQVEDHVCTIRMNRPNALNACSQQMWGDLVAAFRLAGSDPAVRAVILTGEGRAFCVGADLKERSWDGETVTKPPTHRRKSATARSRDRGLPSAGDRSD